MKAIYDKTTAKITLNSEDLESIFFKIRNNMRICNFATFINVVLEVLEKTERKNKKGIQI